METAEDKKEKKRIAQSSAWKCNRRKIARMKELQYSNSKGNIIPASKLGPASNENIL